MSSLLPPTPPPVVTPITRQSILAMLMPMIEDELATAIDAALAAGGPLAVAIVSTLSAMVPAIIAQLGAAQNTPAQQSALAVAIATLDAAITAERAAGA